MNLLSKENYQSLTAHIAEHGPGIITTGEAKIPWLVRNVDGFIYCVEEVGNHIICTVLVPACIFKDKKPSELDRFISSLNSPADTKYTYIIKKIEDTRLIAISAYYHRDSFNITRDIKALEYHAIDVFSEF